DRRFDQLAVVGLLHVVRPQPLEHLAEQAELAIGIGVSRLCARSIEHDARLGCDQRHGYAGSRTEENQGSFAHDHPRILLAVVCGPPRAWIDGNPGLAELHVKYGLVCTAIGAYPLVCSSSHSIVSSVPQALVSLISGRR